MRVKISAGGVAPTRANPSDAGLDLRASSDFVIQPGEVVFHDTKVSFDLSSRQGEYRMVGLVFQRSGFTKMNVTLGNGVGVIDANYRGNIIIALRNLNTEEAVSVHMGDKIAQIVFTPIVIPALDLYEGSDEDWVKTDRGTGGFGSTGR